VTLAGDDNVDSARLERGIPVDEDKVLSLDVLDPISLQWDRLCMVLLMREAEIGLVIEDADAGMVDVLHEASCGVGRVRHRAEVILDADGDALAHRVVAERHERLTKEFPPLLILAGMPTRVVSAGVGAYKPRADGGGSVYAAAEPIEVTVALPADRRVGVSHVRRQAPDGQAEVFRDTPRFDGGALPFGQTAEVAVLPDDFRTVETEFRKQGQGLAQREVWCAERVSEQVHVWSSDV